MGAHLFNIEFRGERGGTSTCRQHEFGLRTCFLQPSRISVPQPLLDRSACIIKVVSHTHTHICFVPATMDRVGDEQPPRMSDDEKRLARKWWHEGKTQPEIASLLSCHKSSISRAVATSAQKKAQGRPRVLSHRCRWCRRRREDTAEGYRTSGRHNSGIDFPNEC